MKKLIIALAVLAPSVAMAAQPITDVNSLTSKVTGIGNTIIGVLISFAVIWIIWNVVRFIMSDSEKRAEIRGSILWGLVGLFVILSIWGVVNILSNTFSTDNQAPVQDFPTNTIPVPVQ
jgi:Na+/proline symporter